MTNETKQATWTPPPWGWIKGKTGYAIVSVTERVVQDGPGPMDAHAEPDFDQIGYAETLEDARLIAEAPALVKTVEVLLPFAEHAEATMSGGRSAEARAVLARIREGSDGR